VRKGTEAIEASPARGALKEIKVPEAREALKVTEAPQGRVEATPVR